MTNKTHFDRLTDKTARAVAKLRALEAAPKLTAAAFVADSLRSGNCTDAQVTKFEKALAATGTDAVSSFINTLARALATSNFPRAVPAAKFNKCVLAYGSAETLAGISAIGGNLGVAVALAARVAVKRWPEGFGAVVDWDAHCAEVVKAKAVVADLIERMGREFRSLDLVIDGDSVTPEQRRAGLARICFRRCRTIGPATDNWPLRLVDHVLGRADPVVVGPEPEEDFDLGQTAFAAGAAVSHLAGDLGIDVEVVDGAEADA